MKAKVYIAPTKYAYRAAEDGQSIQFLDTSMNLGWKHSDYMTDKVLKAARPAQEVLDEEAARRGWQPWEEPKEAPTPQSNAVQLAKDVLDAVRHFKGELTADGCRQAVGKSYFGRSGLDTGGYRCSPRGVKLAPKGEDFMDLTWAKFIKFCRENGLIEEKPLKAASKPVTKRAEENPIHAVEDAPTCAPTVSDAQPSPPPSVGVDVPTEEKTPLNNYCKTGQSPSGHCGAAACCGEHYECCAQCPKDCNARCGWISAKEENVCTKPAPKPAAAATTNWPAAMNSSPKDAGMQTPQSSSDLDQISTSGLCSPADCAAASLATASASPAPMAAEFDYTGLDQPTVDTLHLAERMIRDARRDYITKLAQAVYIVHDALCGGVVAICDNSKHGHRGEDTFRAWCTSVGLGKDTAYRLLQVAALLNGSTPEEQAVLEAASPSLLYAAAKPSAPAQLVQGVKDGDITTHKQYQELLARLKATEEELTSVQQEAALDRKEQEDANAAALRYKAEADRRAQDQQRLEGRIKTLESRADEAERNLAGAREALTAAKARGDRWQEKCEALEAQAAAPAIEARVVDPEEVEHLAAEKAEALAAQQMAQRDAEDARAAYDAVILATRSMDAAWQALAPMLPRLAPEEKGQAIHQFVNKLMCIKEDVLKCL